MFRTWYLQSTVDHDDWRLLRPCATQSCSHQEQCSVTLFFMLPCRRWKIIPMRLNNNNNDKHSCVNQPFHLCMLKIAYKLLKSHLCTETYTWLANYTKTFGCLIALAYSAQQQSVFPTSPPVVTITLARFQRCTDAEVVPLHSHSAGGGSVCLLVMNMVKPVWLLTDASFVASNHNILPHLANKGQLFSWHSSVFVHVTKIHSIS